MLASLRQIKHFSTKRTGWILLIISTACLELTALYFQHIMHLLPCVLCIYQRCAIFGILVAGIIGSIAPKNRLLRFIAIILWLYCSYQGLLLAHQLVSLQFYPSFTDFCSPFIHFPSWFPLDSWLPMVFQAQGDCSEKAWKFLSLEMSQWMKIIFYSYLITSGIVLLCQLIRSKNK